MEKKFLENERYTFLVAQAAVLFQSFVTSAVIMILIGVLFGISYPRTMLMVLLSVDGLFVVAHLTYRRMYRGQKVVLMRGEKVVLILHILSALLALGMTSYIVYEELQVSLPFIGVALFMWVASLVFGILFFMKKYRDGRAVR